MKTFFNDTATTEIYTIAYTLSLHDALPIFSAGNYSICLLHEENNTLHEYLTINSFKEVTCFVREIIYEERQD